MGGFGGEHKKNKKTMLETHCEFTLPVDYEGNLIGNKQDTWNFRLIDCTSTDPSSTIALITNDTTGAEFYIDKKLSYGDILILTFLLLFAIFGIVKVITDFWIPSRVIRKS